MFLRPCSSTESTHLEWRLQVFEQFCSTKSFGIEINLQRCLKLARSLLSYITYWMRADPGSSVTWREVALCS